MCLASAMRHGAVSGRYVVQVMARPTKFKPEYAKQAAKLCELGATDIELADFFGVNVTTIYEWRNQNVAFSKAVIAGKEMADARVERAFYNRAVGYTFDTEKIFQFQGDIIRAPSREHVPPDAGAALNWLKNRNPDKWRDKQEIDLKVTDTLAERMARMKARKADASQE